MDNARMSTFISSRLWRSLILILDSQAMDDWTPTRYHQRSTKYWGRRDVYFLRCCLLTLYSFDPQSTAVCGSNYNCHTEASHQRLYTLRDDFSQLTFLASLQTYQIKSPFVCLASELKRQVTILHFSLEMHRFKYDWSGLKRVLPRRRRNID